MDYREAAEEIGLTTLRVMAVIAGMLNATKWVWDQETGEYVPGTEPDWQVRIFAFDCMLELGEKSEDWRRLLMKTAALLRHSPPGQ